MPSIRRSRIAAVPGVSKSRSSPGNARNACTNGTKMCRNPSAQIIHRCQFAGLLLQLGLAEASQRQLFYAAALQLKDVSMAVDAPSATFTTGFFSAANCAWTSASAMIWRGVLPCASLRCTS